MQSLPFNISGMQDLWISVGFVMAMDFKECTSHGGTWRDSKDEVVRVEGAEEGTCIGVASGTPLLEGAAFLILEGAT